jgi:diacylglycerol kinase family enzyme
MYHYIYDSFIGERRFRRQLAAIEHKLTELGIVGERERVTPIRTVEEIMKLGLARHAKTIVVFGNDYTFTKALNAGLAAGMDPTETVLAIIPFGEPNYIAKRLGLRGEAVSVQELAARKTATIDVGRVNKRFFITTVDVGFEAEHKTRREQVLEKISAFTAQHRIKKYKPQAVKILIDNQYLVTSPLFNLTVVNLNNEPDDLQRADHREKKLRLTVVPYSEQIINQASLVARREYGRLANASVFWAQEIKIAGPKTVKIATDGVLYDMLPLRIEMIPRAAKMIVGKGRAF